jgi:hypothetical protein
MNSNLPYSNTLPIQILSGVFSNTNSTYKYFWFLSIIELAEQGQTAILKKDIFARMISNAWYTVNYFQVSFGKQDLIQLASQKISGIENYDVDIKRDILFDKLRNSENKSTLKILNHFDLNVPHWFLSPWFSKEKNDSDAKQKKRIYELSQSYDNQVLYKLNDKTIEINPIWIEYIALNSKILKDFCYWNLTLFLQSRNPNVPGISEKLIKPSYRKPLTDQRNNYWKMVFDELQFIECIFTGQKLTLEENNFQIDHFVPHAFVSHDLIWNLLPIEKSFNSSKSDKLPSIDKSFNSFFNLQKMAFEIVRSKSPKNKYIEEFVNIFPELDKNYIFDFQKYKETIQPLITIAHNNGFTLLNE